MESRMNLSERRRPQTPSAPAEVASRDAPESMTLRQLSAASGVTTRTIRRYVERGLLAGAHGRSVSARYTRNHLERLQNITALLEQGYLLDDIGKTLNREAEGSLEAAPVLIYRLVPGISIMLDEGQMTDSNDKDVQDLMKRIYAVVRRRFAKKAAESQTSL